MDRVTDCLVACLISPLALCVRLCFQALTDFVPFLPDVLAQSKALDLIVHSAALLGDGINIVAMGVLGDGKLS